MGASRRGGAVDFRTVFIVVVAALALSACVQTHKTPDIDIGPIDSMVVMPVDVELSLLNAGGVNEPRADWTNAARAHIRTALSDRAAGFDARVVQPEQPDIAAALDAEEVQLVKLANAVGSSIVIHEHLPNNALPTKKDGFDWQIGPDARRLKEKYGADHALFIFMRDSYSSGGRVAVMIIGALLGASIQGGTQTGFATLVDLDTGQVVWFNLLHRPNGDLRTDEGAKETVEALLSGFPS